MEAGSIHEKDGMHFLSEIGWREFSHTLLFYNPDLATENYNDSFRHMPWRTDKAALEAWQTGQTPSGVHSWVAARVARRIGFQNRSVGSRSSTTRMACGRANR